MIGDDSNGMRCTLYILSPFREGKDDRKEFPVIDVIVSFSGKESSREISAGVKISVGISLEQDGSCGE